MVDNACIIAVCGCSDSHEWVCSLLSVSPFVCSFIAKVAFVIKVYANMESCVLGVYFHSVCSG